MAGQNALNIALMFVPSRATKMIARHDFTTVPGLGPFKARLTRLAIFTAPLIVFCAMASPKSQAQTQETVTEVQAMPATNVQTMREDAHQLRDRAGSMKSNAEQQFVHDTAECYKKIFVASCLDSAKQRQQKLLAESGELNRKGKDEDREANNLERAAKEAQRAADAPRKEAEEKVRIEKYQREQAEKEASRAAKLEAMARKEAEAERLRPQRLREQQERERKKAKNARNDDERAKRKAAEEKRHAAQAAARSAAKKPSDN